MIRSAVAVLSLLSAAMFATTVRAAEVKLLSAGAVEPGVHKVIDAFRAATGHEVRVLFNTAPAIRKRMAANEAFDLVIAPPAAMDEFLKDGKVVADSRAGLGRVGAGITVRTGAARPDVSGVDAFKRALLAADSVVYNQASTGLYIEKMLDRIGIGDAVRPKTTRYGNGESVLVHVIKGSGAEIGMGAITEIRLFEPKGLQYVGPLPAEIQNYTSYDAAVTANAVAAGPARDFVRFMTTPDAKRMFAAAGIE